jgi:hypothetical protein
MTARSADLRALLETVTAVPSTWGRLPNGRTDQASVPDPVTGGQRDHAHRTQPQPSLTPSDGGSQSRRPCWIAAAAGSSGRVRFSLVALAGARVSQSTCGGRGRPTDKAHAPRQKPSQRSPQRRADGHLERDGRPAGDMTGDGSLEAAPVVNLRAYASGIRTTKRASCLFPTMDVRTRLGELVARVLLVRRQ